MVSRGTRGARRVCAPCARRNARRVAPPGCAKAWNSLEQGLAECHPKSRDRAVPDVLLSGDHGRVAQWRSEMALARTRERRPDLLKIE